ncbi:hypothetical protein OCK74_15355 [Chitinophagaceae bacterium LB-8]|uniref:Uncharacterized protein n=1 Tax=Paraflavisolibacter caeni TaxID=2982496 RepID=A0A9X3BG87_9BACT|nr:hypothetical protein [Paraflavisolibacter caeni]MCU7550494.1 hypothetical protein [Paraflavisolibacter caeni]
MKKLFVCTAIAIIAFSSCEKESLQFAEGQTLYTSAIAQSGTPFNFAETFAIQWNAWNDCTGEWVVFSGTGHYSVHGVINDNKATFSLHYNTSNAKGVGLTSGRQYISTETFNYTNNGSFINEQIVFQQRGTIKYISIGSLDNFNLENDWHLTINANGEVTFFFSTNGPVISC